MRSNFWFIVGLLAIVAAPGSIAEQLPVASFSTVLTEIARKVGRDHVAVSGLLRPGVDPHEYEPTPDDLRRVSAARLILINGLQVENYLGKLEQASGGKSDLLQVGDHLPGLAPNDVHWWNNVRRVEQATALVADELCKLDPADRAAFEQNAQLYLHDLEQLQRWVKRTVAELPRDRRVLVTAHDAFADFAREYGFTAYAIEGVNSEGEASNRHVAELIDRIKKDQVKAIFIESTLNPKVTKEITRETGARIGGVLYADGLGTGAAATYAGMIRHNVSTIVEALK